MQELANELPVNFEEVSRLVAQAEKLVNIYTRRFYFHNDFDSGKKII